MSNLQKLGRKMNFVIVTVLVAVAFLQGITGAVGQLENLFRLASPLQLYAGDTDEVNCTGVTGNVCGKKPENCDSLFLCIPNMQDPIKTDCDKGLFCNEGVCSADKSAFCEYGNGKFKCNNEGMYPEPSSCKKFNYCVPTPPVPPATEGTLTLTGSECDKGWGFNPATASCDKKLINDKCGVTDRPVPSCLKTGQNDALKGNPSMYYICTPYDVSNDDKALYPYIFKCPGNTKYVGNYVCK